MIDFIRKHLDILKSQDRKSLGPKETIVLVRDSLLISTLSYGDVWNIYIKRTISGHSKFSSMTNLQEELVNSKLLIDS